jgi:hypothetical protein
MLGTPIDDGGLRRRLYLQLKLAASSMLPAPE